MPRLVTVALGVLVTLVAPAAAQAFVTVLGGGYAEACSRAAIVGESDRRFQELCTFALDNEMLDPSDRAGTLVNLAVMKLRRLEYAEAKRDLDDAVRMQPKMGEAYVNRGAAHIGLRRYADGLADLDRSIALGAQEPAKAYYNRALAYEGLGDVKAAYYDYLKAAELSPDWAAPQQELVRFTVQRR